MFEHPSQPIGMASTSQTQTETPTQRSSPSRSSHVPRPLLIPLDFNPNRKSGVNVRFIWQRAAVAATSAPATAAARAGSWVSYAPHSKRLLGRRECLHIPQRSHISYGSPRVPIDIYGGTKPGKSLRSPRALRFKRPRPFSLAPSLAQDGGASKHEREEKREIVETFTKY